MYVCVGVCDCVQEYEYSIEKKVELSQVTRQLYALAIDKIKQHKYKSLSNHLNLLKLYRLHKFGQI